jgi:hypothetical protein
LDLGHVHQKLAEAADFLSGMIEQERQIMSEKFAHHLSAFLAAGMSVRGPFEAKTIEPWRKKWENDSLTTDQKRLYDCMREARNDEAHIARKSRPANRRARKEPGAELIVGQEDIKVGVGSSYSDRSGTVQALGSPSVLYCVDTNVVVHKRTYSYKIDGTERKVTDVCTDYLALLRSMVAQYEVDHPSYP